MCQTTIFKMSGIKKYFKEEFNPNTLVLVHPKPADFYLSAWQTTRSPVPLLIWRTILFLTSLGIVLSSVVIYSLNGIFGFWFIYLTHWGLSLILFATGFAAAVSARCYFYGPISAEFTLPWYVKTQWVLQNTAVPIAFLITIFYWSILYEAGIEEELSHGLDVAVHGINSLVMFLLLLSASQPSRVLHVYQPFVFALCYVAFGLIYYWAGGVNKKGELFIYPVVNWAKPASTIGVCAIVGLLLIFLHCLTVGIALARDAVSQKLVKPSAPGRVEEGLPLRSPVQNT